MRITGGEARGVRLYAPKSVRVRPTSDRVRGALFQLLGNAVPDAHVLDLYAGTGALGIEALSRGAAAADFVEQNTRLCETVDSNLEHTGFTHRAKVYRMRVEQALPVLEGPYQLVLADPPYDLTNINHMIELLSRPGLVDAAGLVVIEHSSRVAVPEACGALQRRDQRRYGDTKLSLYGPINSKEDT